MISQRLLQLILKLGFQEAYIQQKVEEVLSLAKSKNLHIGSNIPMFVCYDMNGPLTSARDAALHPFPGVRDAMSILQKNNVKKALVSGWDVRTLMAFRDRRLELSDLAIVGEHGTVWEQNGVVHQVNPILHKEVIAMKMNIIQKAAQENLKLAIQGNESSRVTGLFFEADGPERGNVLAHILLDGNAVGIADIFSEFARDLGFRFSDGKIAFPLNASTLREFDRVLRTVFPLRSVRLSIKGEEIAFWVDVKDRPNFTVKDMGEFIKRTLSGPWTFMLHDDFGVDIMYEDAPKDTVTKESTAYLVAEKAFGNSPSILTNVGDRPSDVFTRERSIFFAQKNTSAQAYCLENKIPFVSVEHGGDYSLILAALIGAR